MIDSPARSLRRNHKLYFLCHRLMFLPYPLAIEIHKSRPMFIKFQQCTAHFNLQLNPFRIRQNSSTQLKFVDLNTSCSGIIIAKFDCPNTNEWYFHLNYNNWNALKLLTAVQSVAKTFIVISLSPTKLLKPTLSTLTSHAPPHHWLRPLQPSYNKFIGRAVEPTVSAGRLVWFVSDASGRACTAKRTTCQACLVPHISHLSPFSFHMCGAVIARVGLWSHRAKLASPQLMLSVTSESIKAVKRTMAWRQRYNVNGEDIKRQNLA